jgi:hypothetical protein
VEAAAGVIGASVRIPAGLEAVPKGVEEHTVINLSEAISALPEMARLRGVLAEVTPPELAVRVVHMVSRDLPVRVELAHEVSLDGDPIPTPPLVRVRLPESAAAGLDAKLQAIATIGDDSLSRLRNDGPQTVTATIRLPVAVPDISLVAITPDTVSVSLRPRQAVDTTRLANVPVWFSLPPTEDGAKWNVEVLDKFLTDAAVTGPSEEIRRLKAGDLKIKALVELTTDDLEKGAQERSGLAKQASFIGAPPGVTCTVANATVRVKVTKRNPQP